MHPPQFALPFVVGVVGTFLVWCGIEGAPSGGDSWGLRFLWEIPLASGVVGLIAGFTSAHGRRLVGILSGLIGFCVGLLVTPESGTFFTLSLFLGAAPFTVVYFVGAALAATARPGAGGGGA